MSSIPTNIAPLCLSLEQQQALLSLIESGIPPPPTTRPELVATTHRTPSVAIGDDNRFKVVFPLPQPDEVLVATVSPSSFQQELTSTESSLSMSGITPTITGTRLMLPSVAPSSGRFSTTIPFIGPVGIHISMGFSVSIYFIPYSMV